MCGSHGDHREPGGRDRATTWNADRDRIRRRCRNERAAVERAPRLRSIDHGREALCPTWIFVVVGIHAEGLEQRRTVVLDLVVGDRADLEPHRCSVSDSWAP